MSVQSLQSISESLIGNAMFLEQVGHILELNEQSLTKKIVKAMISEGQQALNKFERDLDPRVLREQRDPASQLSVLLVEKLEQELLNNVEKWFQIFLVKQKEENTLYDESFRHLAKQGLESLRENIYLSLTILFLRSRSNANQLWQSLTTYGLEGLDRHPVDNSDPVFQEQRYNRDSVLNHSLTDYFHYSLKKLLQQCRFTFDNVEAFEQTLNSLVRHGLWNGLHKSYIRPLFGDRFEAIENYIIHNGLNDSQAEEEETRLISNCLNTDQLMPLSKLLDAGELVYMNTTLVHIHIFDEFIQQYQSTGNLPKFIHDCLTPIMYLLKRQYNLKDSLNSFIKNREIEISSKHLSLRMLIDVLLQNADYSLSQKVISLLNERNPVPLIQPSNRFVSDVIHIWNYSSPTILSFGIGKCYGKTTLLNLIFLTSFEESVPSVYFRNTIDIDFGLSFVPCRSPSIADAHGSINELLLTSISSLFDGFLIHINYEYLLDNHQCVQDYLNQIKDDRKFHRLIIRDVPKDQEQRCKTFLDSNFPSIKNCILPSIVVPHSDDVKRKLTSLREELLHQLPKQCLDEASDIRSRLRALMNLAYREHFDRSEQMIGVLEKTLIQIAENNLRDEDYFFEYLKFVKLCKSKLEMIRCHFFDHENEQIIEQLRRKMLKDREDFLQVNQRSSGIFELFWKFLQMPDMIVSLELLGTRLKQERARIMKEGKTSEKTPVKLSLFLEFLWRDAIISSVYRSSAIQQALQTYYYQYIQNGFPFEIIDGDNFFLQYQFLNQAVAILPQKRLLVISIIGPQNSGKSTLLNYMFGTLFDVRDIRCTRGIYGSFVKSNVPEFDQILLIDTKGLLSLEREDAELDRRILLLCLALSHIVIVNVVREITSTLQTLLTLSIDSLSRIGVTRIDRPMIYFILNQRTQMDLENNTHAIAIPSILNGLRKHHLDRFVRINRESFHALPKAFQSNGSFGSSDLRETLSEFRQGVEKIGSKIIKSARKYFQESNETWTILQWLSLVNTIFETICQFPHLTRYCDIAERLNDEQIRPFIQKQLNDISALRYDNKMHDAQVVIVQQEHKNKLEASQLSYSERTKKYLEIQIRLIFDAFRRSAMIDHYVNWVQTVILHGNDELRQLICRRVDDVEFDRSFSAMIDPKNMKFSLSVNLIESMKFIYSSYHMCEFDHLLEYTHLAHGISLLNQTATSVHQYEQRFLDHFVRLGYRYTSVKIEKLNSHTASTTITFDNSLNYLNHNMFVHYLQQCQSSSNDQNEEIRRILKEQGLITEKTSATIDENHMLLSMRKIFKELINRLKRTNAEFDVKQIRDQVIPNVIGTINALIREIEQELQPFCLILSRQLKSSFHTCAVLFLTKLYHDRQHQRIQEALSCAKKYRDAMREFCLNRVQSSRSNDEIERSNLFATNIREHIQLSHQLNAQEIIDQHDHFSRKQIQKQCDQQLFLGNDSTWSFNYLRNPLAVIEKTFDESWRNHIETTINVKLVDLKSSYVSVIEELFNFIQNFFADISTFGDSPILINEMFITESTNAYTIYENFLNKKRCFVRLFYTYLTERQIIESFAVDRTTYSLRKDIYDVLNRSCIARQPSVSLSTLTKEMSKYYENLSIDHPKTFFQSLLNTRADITRFCQELKSDFKRLDTKDTYQILLKRVKGCSELCPCCNRPCDVDHNELSSPLKELLTTHACQYGHGLHAFTGKKFQQTNNASLLMCDKIRSDADITTNSIFYSLNLLQLSYSNWSFESQLTEQELRESLCQWLLVWEKIGRQICSHYGMTYVIRNSLN